MSSQTANDVKGENAMKHSVSIGIDAGTTNYCVYSVRDQEFFDANLVNDPREQRITPSAIAFRVNCSDTPVTRWFGHSAVQMIGKTGWVVIRNWKRLINKQ